MKHYSLRFQRPCMDLIDIVMLTFGLHVRGHVCGQTSARTGLISCSLDCVAADSASQMSACPTHAVHMSVCPTPAVHMSVCPTPAVHMSVCPTHAVHVSACPTHAVHMSACPTHAVYVSACPTHAVYVSACPTHAVDTYRWAVLDVGVNGPASGYDDHTLLRAAGYLEGIMTNQCGDTKHALPTQSRLSSPHPFASATSLQTDLPHLSERVWRVLQQGKARSSGEG